MIKQDSYFKGIAFVLFLFVFCYLIVRSLFTEPLHDEIATFYFYIYHGDFVGRDLVFDANNHLLNSALGFVLYRIFGEHFFVFRLSNLLSFPIYFYALYQMMRYVNSQSLRTLGLIALVCIPFVLEYFAYCRGYGIGMAFFALSIHFLIQFVQSEKTKLLVFSFGSAWIAVFANMIFINAGLLIIVFLLLWLLANRRKGKAIVVWIALFAVGLSPFIFFAFKLKQAGALYYGSLDGLWDVTGKSLSEMVFFSGSLIVGTLLTALLLVILLNWIFFMLKQDWKEKLKSPAFIINYLLFSCIGLILGLALILNVNYPEDRTGMYLIPLFMLSLIFMMDTTSWFKHLKWTLLFFPISFCFHLSIHSSIYSPDQRMSESFFKKVKAYLKPSHSLGSYHMNFWTWNLMDSKTEKQSSTLLFNHSDEPFYDVILGKKNTIHNPKIFEFYDTLAFDEATHDVAFVRKYPLKKELLLETQTISTWADWEFVSLYETDSLEQFRIDQLIQISVDFTLLSHSKKHYLELVVQTLNENGETIERMFYPIAFVYRNELMNEHLLHHFVIDKISKETKSLKVYIWNKGKDPLDIKNGKCYLYTVKNP